MRYLKYILIIEFLLLLTYQSKAQKLITDSLSCDTLMIVGDRAYPPYEFINEDGVPDGFNMEL